MRSGDKCTNCGIGYLEYHEEKEGIGDLLLGVATLGISLMASGDGYYKCTHCKIIHN